MKLGVALKKIYMGLLCSFYLGQGLNYFEVNYNSPFGYLLPSNYLR
jgi:hypothetical protein